MRPSKPNANWCSLATLQSDQVQLPQVRVLGADFQSNEGGWQQYVELPTRSSGVEPMAFSWRRSGLTLVGNEDGFQQFQVFQANYSATLQEQQLGIEPEILLQANRFNLQSNAEYVAVSEYDLKPANLSRLMLRLPDDATLIQVACDGRRTHFSRIQQDDPAHYEFLLTSSPWPQRVRLVYRGNLQRQGETVALESPRLHYVNGLGEQQVISIANELWSIDGPVQCTAPTEGCRHLGSQAEVDRLTIAAFLQSWSGAQASIRERPRSEKLAFLATWARYLADPIARRPEDTSGDEHWQQLEDLIVEYAEAFTVNLNEHAIQTSDLWDESLRTYNPPMRFLVEGPIERSQVVLGYPRRTAWHQYALAGGLVALGVVLRSWDRGRAVVRQAVSFPHPTVGLAGVLWWLFLSPRWIGVGFVLVATATWLWPRLRILRFSVLRHLRSIRYPWR